MTADEAVITIQHLLEEQPGSSNEWHKKTDQ